MQHIDQNDIISRLIQSDKLTYSGFDLEKETAFSDLFDLAEIQKIQDAFSKATGVASIITQVDGTPITRPSRFCSFCNEIVRKTKIGLENCIYSDSIIGRPQKNGPRIQECLSGGLMDGGASIMVGEKHIANWLIGQVLEHEPDMEAILEYVDEIGADRVLAAKALHDVTRMSRQQFSDVCEFLFITTRQLSDLAMKNVLQAREIVKRKMYELEIKQINENLEKIVQKRTAQLKDLNANLEEKIAKRTKRLSELNAALETEIGARSEVERSLRESERVLYESQKVAHIGSYVLDNQQHSWKGSPELYKILGIDDSYPFSVDAWIQLAHPDFRKQVRTVLFKEQPQKKQFDLEYKIIRLSDSAERWIRHICERAFVQSHLSQIIGTVQDITEYKESANEILYLSYHDTLTDLYNRRYYEEEIKRVDKEKNLPISVIIGDVNGLKVMNDAFGHAMGDELLIKAAAVIKNACRRYDVAARWGGDEFVLLLPKTASDEAEKMIGSIKKQAADIFVCDIPLSISFGWDTKGTADVSILQVLKNAEDLMYKNKVAEKKGMRSNTITTILSALHEKSPREEQHSARVSELCQSIGKAMSLPEMQISMLQTAGLLHDIGKIAIDEDILNKPGKLNPREWEDIKRHPDIGYRILGSSYDMLELAECILAHHERWDGTGYPKGLKGSEIPTEARIIAVADTYDAMTSERPYRHALSQQKALDEILRCAGTQFDPDIARVFVEKVSGYSG